MSDYDNQMLAASASIFNNAMAGFAQANINRRTQKYNKEMYERQRQDLLSDWHMQNEYNSPSGQMARLKAANLNPNLVYGNGAVATSAAPPKSADVQSWNPGVPRYDFSGVGDAVMSIYDIRLKEAQTNNLEVQNTVIAQEALMKAAQIKNIEASTGKTKIDTDLAVQNLSQAKALANVTLEKAQAELDKTRVDTQYTINQDERAAALNASTIAKAAEEVLSLRAGRAKTAQEGNLIRQQITNLQSDQRLKELDINLKQAGIQPGDPLWARIIGQVAAGVSIDKIKADIKNAPNQYRKAFGGEGKKTDWKKFYHMP